MDVLCTGRDGEEKSRTSNARPYEIGFSRDARVRSSNLVQFLSQLTLPAPFPKGSLGKVDVLRTGRDGKEKLWDVEHAC